MTRPTSRTNAVRAARLRGQRRQPHAPLDRRRQDVAAAAHCLDELGVAAVILQLAAQAADRDVDRPVERAGLAATQQVEQHVAGQHAVGALDQRQQQVVFAAGQRDLDTVGVEQPAARRLQRPAGEAQVARTPARTRPLPASPARRSTARMRASSSRGLNGFGT